MDTKTAIITIVCLLIGYGLRWLGEKKTMFQPNKAPISIKEEPVLTSYRSPLAKINTEGYKKYQNKDELFRPTTRANTKKAPEVEK